MKTSLVRVAAALAVPLLAVAACSSGSHDASTSRAAADSAGGSSAREGGPVSAPAPGAKDALADTSEKTTPTIEQPSIISQGVISLSAKDVAKARAQVQHVADGYGGMVTDQETSTAEDGKMGYARLVLRIPARSFAQAMDDLEQVADLVDSSTTSEDVSTQVIDVDERVRVARASIERIRTLLRRAEKIGDIMAIESQLSSREADLNSLLRQQAHLGDQTTLSTISVSIDRPAVAHTHRASDDSGFLAGLRAGWDALRGFGTGVATIVGALLPWTPVALLVGLPGWLVLRRLRRTGPAPEALGPQAPGTGA